MTTTKDQAELFITSRYTEASNYAATAQAGLSTFLTDLGTLMTTFTGTALDFSSIVFPQRYVPGAVGGDKPVMPVIPTAPLTADLTVTHTDDVTVSDVNVELVAALKSGLTGGKLLSAEGEQALYDRAIARKDLENARIEANATELWASRGFEMPSDVLLDMMADADKEQTRNTLEVNTEIIAKSAELAMQTASVMVQAASGLNQTWIQHLDSINDRVVRIKTANVGMILQAYATTAKTIVDSYLGEVQAYAALTGAEVSIEQLELSAVETATKNAGVQKELILKEAELRLQEARNSLQLQMEALKSGAQVNAQVVASALSSVNASTSYGFSWGGSENTSTSTDATKSVISETIVHNLTT